MGRSCFDDWRADWATAPSETITNLKSFHNVVCVCFGTSNEGKGGNYYDLGPSRHRIVAERGSQSGTQLNSFSRTPCLVSFWNSIINYEKGSGRKCTDNCQRGSLYTEGAILGFVNLVLVFTSSVVRWVLIQMFLVLMWSLKWYNLLAGSQFCAVVCGWLLQWYRVSPAYQNLHGARWRSHRNWNRQDSMVLVRILW